jgi:hypothetical protein
MEDSDGLSLNSSSKSRPQVRWEKHSWRRVHQSGGVRNWVLQPVGTCMAAQGLAAGSGRDLQVKGHQVGPYPQQAVELVSVSKPGLWDHRDRCCGVRRPAPKNSPRESSGILGCSEPLTQRKVCSPPIIWGNMERLNCLVLERVLQWGGAESG